MPQTKQANFLYLLAGLLVTTIANPLYEEITGDSLDIVWQLAFCGTLIIGLWSLVTTKSLFYAGIALSLFSIVLTAISVNKPSLLLDTLSLLTFLVFCSISLVISLQHVLFDRKMDLNRMVGGICAYLLLGLLIGILNILIHLYIPGSFAGLNQAATGRIGSELVYYSFVTMTTLGYGDITPVGPIARIIAYLASITGQFYIAILVGTLVGMYLSQRRDDESKSSEHNS